MVLATGIEEGLDLILLYYLLSTFLSLCGDASKNKPRTPLAPVVSAVANLKHNLIIKG
jgi:hypothetical protein